MFQTVFTAAGPASRLLSSIVLGGADRMVLPVCGDAGGLGLQQEGDNDPAFLEVVLGLAAGWGYGGRAWSEWEDIWFS